MFHCSQLQKRQHKAKKTSDPGKQRNKGQMSGFDCDGWLFITVFNGSDEVYVKFRHRCKHTPYWSIDVPEKIQEYVQQNARLSLKEV
jgi:hypothetical protein